MSRRLPAALHRRRPECSRGTPPPGRRAITRAGHRGSGLDHTDGITEARGSGATALGVERFTDFRRRTARP